VLADQSGRYPPTEWARIAIRLYRQHNADRIVAEVNNGGAMVEATVRVVDANVSYKPVHASRGKVVRAQPVAALYEQSRIHHVGAFPALEDQMCAFTTDFDRAAAGFSIDVTRSSGRSANCWLSPWLARVSMIWQESMPRRSKPGKPKSRKQHGSSRSMRSAASNMPNSSGAWLRGRNKEECLGRKPNRDRHCHQPDAAGAPEAARQGLAVPCGAPIMKAHRCSALLIGRLPKQRAARANPAGSARPVLEVEKVAINDIGPELLERLARGQGVKAISVNRRGALDEALCSAFATTAEPTLVEVAVD
jgi:hypothetical protein